MRSVVHINTSEMGFCDEPNVIGDPAGGVIIWTEITVAIDVGGFLVSKPTKPGAIGIEVNVDFFDVRCSIFKHFRLLINCTEKKICFVIILETWFVTPNMSEVLHKKYPYCLRCVVPCLGTNRQCSFISRLHYCHGGNHIDGFVQDCSISSALSMEILQSCTKPSIWLCQRQRSNPEGYELINRTNPQATDDTTTTK